MEDRLIVYGSRYGATKRYAVELAKRLKVQAVEFQYAKNISAFRTIIYVGALYAGGVLGLDKTLKLIKDTDYTQLIIITVGLADPQGPENVEHIRTGIKNIVQEPVFSKLRIFHLRGAITYAKLGFMHKMMMRMVYNKAKKTPKEQQTQEIKAMIATYNKQVDFVDFNALDPILRQIQA